MLTLILTKTGCFDKIHSLLFRKIAIMALSFFRAFNPVSENSGITYCLAGNHPCQDHEMLDVSVTQGIYNAFRNDYYLISALRSTYATIVGCHYDIYLRGRITARGGSKGVLDFLIFPLIARKLIADAFLPENRNNGFSKLLAAVVGLPFEIIRLLIGIILTIVLSPFVLLIHAIKIWNTSPEARQEMARINDILPPIHFVPRQPENLPPIPQLVSGANHNRISHLTLDIPPQFVCPLSLEIMTDPVFVMAHPEHRFERSWIQAHLSQVQNNPLNRDFLNLEGIQEDVTIRNQIEQYIEEQLQNAPSQTANMM